MTNNFNTVSWAFNTNIYEVNLRQYTEEGTINAFAEHLPRLKDMGVHTLWFMPLQPVGLLNRKGILGSYYSIRDYISINPEFGTAADFKKLVDDAHALGFKIIIDWVANHTAWDHVWTISNPDFFTKDAHGKFRPPYPDWEDVIHLNYDNPRLWTAKINEMKFWINEFDIDGFRCDMAHLVRLDFWKEARTELEKIKKLFWLAETEEPSYHEVFDASYTWEFLHKMEAYWRSETDISGLDWVLNKYESNFPNHALHLFFTSNHDENSHSGSEYERMGEAAKAFAVLCATWKGIPLIYSGQELPVKRRLAFFEKDKIEWTENIELHSFYKTLLNLHTKNPALLANDSQTFRLGTTADDILFAYLRKNGESEVLVILNLSATNNFTAKITDERVGGKFRNVFTKEFKDFSFAKNVELQAWDYLVYEK